MLEQLTTVYTPNHGLRKVKSTIAFCVFIYEKEEDLNETQDKNPVVCKTIEEVTTWLTNAKLDYDKVVVVIEKMAFLS